MAKKEIVIFADYSQESTLSLEEICDVCETDSQFIYDLINYDIIHPELISQNEWRFKLHELRRIKRALRMQRDLDLNLAGIALVMELLDRLEELQAEMKLFEKHYL